MIGQQTAEEIKLEIGSAFPLPEEVQAEVRGRDLVTGLPKTVVLTSEEVRGALEEPLSQIIGAVKETLDRTPPELASDIMDRGIMLAGGGALLQGLDERLRDETQMPCHLAESPLTCVAVGSGRSLEEFEVIHRASKNSRNTGVGTSTDAVRGAQDDWASPPRRAYVNRLEEESPLYKKSVRRRRAVLAAARQPLHSTADRLLRRVRLGRPACDPARLPGGDGAAPGGRQPGAEAGPRPGRLDRRRVRRQVRERRPARARSSSCAASWPRRRRPSATPRQLRALVGFNRSSAFPGRLRPGAAPA